ncbi:MAG: CvpA family protein [Lachnospiraceae bacterium]|nr:CvpA family protein [Lachnospiraceae bacterium]
MYIVLGTVVLIYIWRIFRGSRAGLIDEAGALADIVIVSFAVVAGIVVIESALEKNLIGFLVAGIILLLILIARKLLRLVFSSLGMIAKLPLLNGLNKFLGMLAGIVEATVVIWVGFAVISCLKIPIKGQLITELIQENVFLDFLYKRNLLYNFIQRMIGIFL